VAAKRDRIARDTVIATAVERACDKAGARLRTADGASDAAGPEGQLMRGIVDVFSQYEREVIRARTRAALAVKRAKRELTGTAPYGWQALVDGALAPDVQEQTTIAIMRTMRADGFSMRGIVQELAYLGVQSRAGKPLQLTQVARILG
jgi:DNA invertase Pin-like site-specific DNA recombinase